MLYPVAIVEIHTADAVLRTVGAIDLKYAVGSAIDVPRSLCRGGPGRYKGLQTPKSSRQKIQKTISNTPKFT